MSADGIGREADRWRAWAEATRLITAAASRDLDTVLDGLIEHAKALLRADGVAVNLAVPGTDEFVRRRAIHSAESGAELAPAGDRFGADPILAEAVATGRPVVALDYQRDPRIGPEYRLANPSVAVGMAVPLRADDELVGYFFCSWTVPTTLEPIDVELAQILADHTALAIRAARAIEAERAARRAADELAVEARRAGVELEALLDASLDALHVVDVTGRMVRVNRQQRKVYMARWGKVPASIQEWRSLMAGASGDGAPREPLAVERALAGEAAERFQTAPGLDGTPRRYHVQAAPILDEGGQVAGAVVTTRDVTALHEMIEERARLDGALKTVRTVAHELNNKLSVLTLYAETIPKLPPTAAAEATTQMTNLALDVAALIKRFQGVVRFAETDVGGGLMLDLEAATGAR